MAKRKLITLDEAAARLGGIARNTLLRRLAEAGIRPPKPGRHAMLTERDFTALVEAIRARSPAPPAARPAQQALRAAQRRQTQRLGAKVRGQVRGQVVALDLERK